MEKIVYSNFGDESNKKSVSSNTSPQSGDSVSAAQDSSASPDSSKNEISPQTAITEEKTPAPAAEEKIAEEAPIKEAEVKSESPDEEKSNSPPAEDKKDHFVEEKKNEVPLLEEKFKEAPPAESKKPVEEFFIDWFLLGFVFTITLVILFVFAGVMDVNIAYSIKYFFQYIVLSLTVAMLAAGIAVWLFFKRKKVGYFSIGMAGCIAVVMLIVILSNFVPGLLPLSNAIMANDGPFTRETLSAKFSENNAFFGSSALQGEDGSALRAIYRESSVSGIKDINFW